LEQTLREYLAATFPKLTEMLGQASATKIDAEIAKTLVLQDATVMWVWVSGIVVVVCAGLVALGLRLLVKSDREAPGGTLMVFGSVMGFLGVFTLLINLTNYYDYKAELASLNALKANPLAVQFGGRP
jgi:integral membrane sensor domain MASE1